MTLLRSCDVVGAARYSSARFIAASRLWRTLRVGLNRRRPWSRTRHPAPFILWLWDQSEASWAGAYSARATDDSGLGCLRRLSGRVAGSAAVAGLARLHFKFAVGEYRRRNDLALAAAQIGPVAAVLSLRSTVERLSLRSSATCSTDRSSGAISWFLDTTKRLHPSPKTGLRRSPRPCVARLRLTAFASQPSKSPTGPFAGGQSTPPAAFGTSPDSLERPLPKADHRPKNSSSLYLPHFAREGGFWEILGKFLDCRGLEAPQAGLIKFCPNPSEFTAPRPSGVGAMKTISWFPSQRPNVIAWHGHSYPPATPQFLASAGNRRRADDEKGDVGRHADREPAWPPGRR